MEIEKTNHSASMISLSLPFIYLKLLQLVYVPNHSNQFISHGGECSLNLMQE